MGSRAPIPTIVEVVQLLGLKVDPRHSINAESFNVQCPFCGDKKYHMNINTKKNCYNCVRCNSGEKGLGTLDLYGRARFGTPHRKGPGGNGGELLHSLLKELGKLDESGGRKPPPLTSAQQSKPPVSLEIPTASNKKLDAAFRFVFSWAPFQLSQKHRDNLIRRGLDDQAIARNGYVTMPADMSWLKAPEYDRYRQWYAKENLGKLTAQFVRTQKQSADEVIAGLALASAMREAGIDLRGIPGAYLLGKHWCFYYQPGMLIPTRDQNGLIVGAQVRTDQGKLRYMTLSSKGLPKGPTTNIARTHFPLGNAVLGPDTEVLLTEGPVKGDVTVALAGKPLFVMAIQGVNNAKELNGLFRMLRLAGVKNVGCAFDMDKILNQNVRKSSKALAKRVKAAGLEFYQKCWDLDYCLVKTGEMTELCRKHGVQLQQDSPEPFRHLAYLADALYAAGIPYAKDKEDYWKPESKGIDDFLLQQQKTKQ